MQGTIGTEHPCLRRWIWVTPDCSRTCILKLKEYHSITVTSQWARWRLKSPASRLLFVQAQIKENIKAPRHWPLWGEFTCDRWIPRTEGQWRGKCFRLMTSSCHVYFSSGSHAILPSHANKRTDLFSAVEFRKYSRQNCHLTAPNHGFRWAVFNGNRADLSHVLATNRIIVKVFSNIQYYNHQFN